MSKKRAHIVSSFTDAGTGESFTAGDTTPIDAGAFENYKAAGLVREPEAQRKATTSSKARKRSSTKRRSLPPAPSSPPAPAVAPTPPPAADPASEDPAPSA